VLTELVEPGPAVARPLTSATRGGHA
jgi:hypothetical protein